MDIEQSASVENSDEEIVKENEETKQKIKERNREYVRAWRRRNTVLKKKKKLSKEEKAEARRKRRREHYHRMKCLKEKDKNLQELSQMKLDDLLLKRKKLDSNDDQEHVVQCKLEQNDIYEESNKCITPKVILHRITDIPRDGDCLFHSLIRALHLQIPTCDLRRQLRDSPFLNSCHNPQEVYNILSSDEYGDLDCVYLSAKVYSQNICLHYHYFNVTTKDKETRFGHFKANDTNRWIHLDLRGRHFTPYISDEEKKKEHERIQKEKSREYSKRYRARKKTSSQTGPSRDVFEVPVLHSSQTAGPSRDVFEVPVVHTSLTAGPSTGVPYVPPVICSPKIADLTRDVPLSLPIHSNYNPIEDRVRQRLFQIVESSPPHLASALQQNCSAHRQFEIKRIKKENTGESTRRKRHRLKLKESPVLVKCESRQDVSDWSSSTADNEHLVPVKADSVQVVSTAGDGMIEVKTEPIDIECTSPLDLLAPNNPELFSLPGRHAQSDDQSWCSGTGEPPDDKMLEVKIEPGAEPTEPIIKQEILEFHDNPPETELSNFKALYMQMKDEVTTLKLEKQRLIEQAKSFVAKNRELRKTIEDLLQSSNKIDKKTTKIRILERTNKYLRAMNSRKTRDLNALRKANREQRLKILELMKKRGEGSGVSRRLRPKFQCSTATK